MSTITMLGGKRTKKQRWHIREKLRELKRWLRKNGIEPTQTATKVSRDENPQEVQFIHCRRRKPYAAIVIMLWFDKNDYDDPCNPLYQIFVQSPGCYLARSEKQLFKTVERGMNATGLKRPKKK